jgi:hypothetical protein
VRYRLTLECGASSVIDELARRRLLRLAAQHGYGRTRVPAGDVVTLPGGALMAVLAEGPSIDRRSSVHDLC